MPRENEEMSDGRLLIRDVTRGGPVRPVGPARLEQGGELVRGQAGVADEGAQGALGQFRVVGHREAAVRGLAVPQNDVAAGLVVNFVAELPERADSGPAGDDREPGQTATSTISSVMAGGTGSPCLARLAR